MKSCSTHVLNVPMQELVACPDASAVAGLPSYVTKLTECYETADQHFSCYGTGEHGAAGGGSSSSSSSSSSERCSTVGKSAAAYDGMPA